ncbi:hypothetical protein [Novosphingobium terrae]|uniref:hypothetical protein n=1 Tax=Novosphingobium terrae TaxID=2726189 RepID=UPI00197F5C24|nr:hypothetical protein [Novosphingobium terrae]
MRFLYGVLILLGLFAGVTTPAYARDLTKTDPDRARILDAARQFAVLGTSQASEEIKWVVRDLYRDGDVAYLCAARVTDGAIDRTDDAIDGYLFGLKRFAGAWSVAAETGTFFSAKAKPSDCWYKDKTIQSQADVEAFLQANAVDVTRLKAQSDEEDKVVQTYQRMAERASPPKGGWLVATQKQAMDLAIGLLSRHQLTTVKPDCLSVDVVGDDTAFYLVEFDVQSGPACKGPARLFAIAIDRATGRMTTDAAKPNGLLRPIE